ncbi:collagen-binding domain-containing protein [Photobacterium aphoticum]|uniref:Choice-of-anchor A domain-containing protein n=1 Tax=Photobacterium aphoticum TaxID=754436 RepID=A0A0J1GSY6_9GAMM|nr:choice-of-anchor A family protein [Photobacterium aphoticum]KLV02833.1 hypothetical protein ABT58_01905 [Photobacterium aphoticum]PSU58163.1 choice-of-anchor A family protein [Photobacterium aphoticum]GHA36428.1 hypothetical protein GCM10007086_07070 [Photobacterium aphoticum]
MTVPIKLLACLLLLPLPAYAGAIDILKEYNLIVFDDLTTTSEVEGKTIVYGNINGTASNYGIQLPTASGPEDALILQGDNNATLNVNNGYGIAIGGSNNGTINLNGGGAQTNSVAAYNLSQIRSDLINLSTSLQALSPNSLLTLPGSQPNPATFEVGNTVSTSTSVFNIDAVDFFGNNNIQQYDIDLNGQSPSAIVINVAGQIINDSTLGNPVGNFVTDMIRQLIIWNFYEATQIDLVREFHGSVLAPIAALSTITPINGSVVVNSFQQDGEIHLPTFDGRLPTPQITTFVSVSEPPSMALFASLLALFLMRRRVF